MSHSRSLRAIGLFLGGVLATVGLFAAPKYASSASREGEAVQGAIVYEQKTPSASGPAHRSSRLFPANDDCAAVKLDVWINRGFLTYALFGNPDAGAPPAESADVSGKTTMLIGGKNCRVRVVIERVDDSGDGQ
jgi:hypothetical protein